MWSLREHHAHELLSNLELPSIGWQLFVLVGSHSDATASLSLLDTYATRLLTEPLRSSILQVILKQTRRLV